MTARLAALATLIAAMAVLESTARVVLPFGGTAPALVAVVVVLAALEAGPLVGIRVGFAAGLVADLLTPGAPLGLGALVLLIVGFGVGTVRPFLTEGTLAPRVAAVLAGVVTATAVTGLLGAMLDAGAPALVVLREALVTGLLSVAAAPLVAPLVRWLERRFPAADGAMRFGAVRSVRDPYGVRISG